MDFVSGEVVHRPFVIEQSPRILDKSIRRSHCFADAFESQVRMQVGNTIRVNNGLYELTLLGHRKDEDVQIAELLVTGPGNDVQYIPLVRNAGDPTRIVDGLSIKYLGQEYVKQREAFFSKFDINFQDYDIQGLSKPVRDNFYYRGFGLGTNSYLQFGSVKIRCYEHGYGKVVLEIKGAKGMELSGKGYHEKESAIEARRLVELDPYAHLKIGSDFEITFDGNKVTSGSKADTRPLFRARVPGGVFIDLKDNKKFKMLDYDAEQNLMKLNLAKEQRIHFGGNSGIELLDAENGKVKIILDGQLVPDKTFEMSPGDNLKFDNSLEIKFIDFAKIDSFEDVPQFEIKASPDLQLRGRKRENNSNTYILGSGARIPSNDGKKLVLVNINDEHKGFERAIFRIEDGQSTGMMPTVLLKLGDTEELTPGLSLKFERIARDGRAIFSKVEPETDAAATVNDDQASADRAA